MRGLYVPSCLCISNCCHAHLLFVGSSAEYTKVVGIKTESCKVRAMMLHSALSSMRLTGKFECFILEPLNNNIRFSPFKLHRILYFRRFKDRCASLLGHLPKFSLSIISQPARMYG